MVSLIGFSRIVCWRNGEFMDVGASYEEAGYTLKLPTTELSVWAIF